MCNFGVGARAFIETFEFSSAEIRHVRLNVIFHDSSRRPTSRLPNCDVAIFKFAFRISFVKISCRNPAFGVLPNIGIAFFLLIFGTSISEDQNMTKQIAFNLPRAHSSLNRSRFKSPTAWNMNAKKKIVYIVFVFNRFKNQLST